MFYLFYNFSFFFQPMLEAANPDKGKPKKPNKPGGSKPQQRFWPVQQGAAGGGTKQKSAVNGAKSPGGGAESESDSGPSLDPSNTLGATTVGAATAFKPQPAHIQNNNNNNSMHNAQQQQLSALKLPSATALQQLMASGGMIGGGTGASAALTAERLQQLQQQMQVVSSASLPSSFTPTFSSAQPSSAEAAALLAQTEAAAFMGCLPGSGGELCFPIALQAFLQLYLLHHALPILHYSYD